MDIEADFEYQPREARTFWLRTQGLWLVLGIALGLGGIVVATLPGGAHPARGALVLIGLLAAASGVRRYQWVQQNLPRPGSAVNLRFTDVGLSVRDQFVSSQVRWPAIRRVRRRHGWLVFEGTQSVRNRAIPARALSEVQIEELTQWLIAQKLMR